MLSDAAALARLRAYRLMESNQTEDHASAREELAGLAVEADVRDWPEVALLAGLGVAQCAVLRPRPDDDVVGMVDAGVRHAESLGAPGLLALALSLRSLVDAGREDTAALVADAARAVALVIDEDAPALERCTVLVVCAAVYNTLGLWELCDELYAEALRLVPACEAPVQEPAITANQVLLRVEWAAGLLEIGDRDAALEQLDRVPAALEQVHRCAGVPDLWRLAAVACGEAASFLVGAYRTVGRDADADGRLDERRLRLERLRRELAAAGDVEASPLVDGLFTLGLLARGRHHDASAVAPLDTTVRSASSGASTFTAWVHALAVASGHDHPATIAQREYGELVAGLRWQARRAVLSAARSSIADARAGVHLARLSRDVLLDPLTGLSNRRRFDDWLAEEPAEERATALLLVDLDAFKDVNDGHGHAVGDEALRRVARLLEQHVRPGDVALRLGGDEFAVILHGGPERDLAAVAEDRARALRSSVAATDWDRISSGLDLAISVGVATALRGPGHPGAADRLYRAADAALYLAKPPRAAG